MIRNNQNLTGTCQTVNANIAKHLTLCFRYKTVAGAYNQIHLSYTFSSVSISSNRLGTAMQ